MAAFVPLRELRASSRGIGKWRLRVVSAEVESFKYGKQTPQKEGKSLHCVLLSQDSALYCRGVVKRNGTSAKAQEDFDRAVAKFKPTLIFDISKVTFDEKSDRAWNSSPVKHVIDLAKSHTDPVLQSTADLPQAPAPGEDLAKLVEVSQQQLCDVTAVVKSLENERRASTRYGERKIADITIIDGSATTEGKTAFATFPVFLPTDEAGLKNFKLLEDSEGQPHAISFFGLVCTPKKGTVTISTGPSFYFKSCQGGAKADKLMQTFEQLQRLEAAELQQIATQDTWMPQEKKDWKAPPAIHCSCILLQAALREGVSLYHRAASDDGGAFPDGYLVQINHSRIQEPACGTDVATKDGLRLFVPVRVADRTGSVELRMREDVALELSRCTDKDDFEQAVQRSHVSFPMLASFRVLIRERHDAGAAEHGEEESLSAVIVTGEEQRLDVEFSPNKALHELNPLLALLPTPTDRMLIAHLNEIDVSPHSGLIVGQDRAPCDCALSFIASTRESDFEVFGEGHRILTLGVTAVDFRSAPGDAKDVVAGNVASVCTMKNMPRFTLSPTRPGSPMFALVLISHVIQPAATGSAADQSPTFIADKVQLLAQDTVADCKAMLRKLCRASDDVRFEGTPKRAVEWAAGSTPYSGRKARRLSASPTADGLED